MFRSVRICNIYHIFESTSLAMNIILGAIVSYIKTHKNYIIIDFPDCFHVNDAFMYKNKPFLFTCDRNLFVLIWQPCMTTLELMIKKKYKLL